MTRSEKVTRPKLFTIVFAITTGAWNHSFAALQATRECVVAIPTVDLLDRAIGIGTCSGADIDKFAKFKLTASQPENHCSDRQGNGLGFYCECPSKRTTTSRSVPDSAPHASPARPAI